MGHINHYEAYLLSIHSMRENKKLIMASHEGNNTTHLNICTHLVKISKKEKCKSRISNKDNLYYGNQ